jgi:ABC-type nitrate/sulfonate/bicarbonate transport system substrate-binding protein
MARSAAARTRPTLELRKRGGTAVQVTNPRPVFARAPEGALRPVPRPHRIWLLVWLGLMAGACDKHAAAASRDKKADGFELHALRYQSSVGTVIYPELAEDLGFLAPIKLELVGTTPGGPQDIQATVTGNTDFGGASNGAVINLVAAGAAVRSVVGAAFVDAQNRNGFFVLDGSPVKNARDLIGKKVAMNTVGAHAEFVLREYLTRGGLTKQEIEQVTLVVLPPNNTEQALRQRQVDGAMLSSIFLEKATEKGGIHTVFSDFDLFGKFTAASYILTDKFIAQNPNTARHFVAATSRAIEWARTTPREQVVARMRSIVERRKSHEDGDALRYWRTPSSDTQGGLLTDRQFQLSIDWLVQAGQLRRDRLHARQLYTNELNPYAQQTPH